MNKKNILITIGITLFIFLFISFLVYSIYCFGYYDKYQEESYIKNANKKDIEFIYENIIKDDSLTKEDYLKSVNIMLDRTKVEQIYNEYYKEEYTIDEFLEKYYFGNPTLTKENVEFIKEGKSNYFKRRKLYIKEINIKNNTSPTKLGIIKNITLNIEPKSTLYLDNKLICENTPCIIDKIYGGIHEIKYLSNNYEYYGLININSNNTSINIPNIESLIRINQTEISKNNSSLLVGKYVLSECYMAAYCPKRISNLILYNNGKADLNLYINTTDAEDYYRGTYEISNSVLELHFEGHTFKALDYDNGYYTTFEINTPRTITFKIEDEKTIKNDDYKFKFNGNY